MIDLRVPILSVVLFGMAVAAAPAQQLSPSSPEFVLKELERIEQQREDLLRTGVSKAHSTLSAASSRNEAAVSLYEDAVRATRFAGLGRESSQFREWRTGPGSALSSSASQKALRYHLQYMVYTLQRATGEKVEKLAPAVLAYAVALQNDMEHIGPTRSLDQAIERQAANPTQRQRLQEEKKEREFAKKLLDEDVSRSPIAKYLMIDGELAKAQDWPKSAGALDEIYQTVVLPEFRRLKDPRLIAYWDDKIRRESEKAEQSGASFDETTFTRVQKPRLLWARADDMAVLGDTQRSIVEKLGIIRTNPMHPDVPKWIAALKKTVAGPEESSTPAPVTPSEDAGAEAAAGET